MKKCLIIITLLFFLFSITVVQATTTSFHILEDNSKQFVRITGAQEQDILLNEKDISTNIRLSFSINLSAKDNTLYVTISPDRDNPVELSEFSAEEYGTEKNLSIIWVNKDEPNKTSLSFLIPLKELDFKNTKGYPNMPKDTGHIKLFVKYNTRDMSIQNGDNHIFFFRKNFEDLSSSESLLQVSVPSNMRIESYERFEFWNIGKDQQISFNLGNEEYSGIISIYYMKDKQWWFGAGLILSFAFSFASSFLFWFTPRKFKTEKDLKITSILSILNILLFFGVMLAFKIIELNQAIAILIILLIIGILIYIKEKNKFI